MQPEASPIDVGALVATLADTAALVRYVPALAKVDLADTLEVESAVHDAADVLGKRALELVPFDGVARDLALAALCRAAASLQASILASHALMVTALAFESRGLAFPATSLADARARLKGLRNEAAGAMGAWFERCMNVALDDLMLFSLAEKGAERERDVDAVLRATVAQRMRLRPANPDVPGDVQP